MATTKRIGYTFIQPKSDYAAAFYTKDLKQTINGENMDMYHLLIK